MKNNEKYIPSALLISYSFVYSRRFSFGFCSPQRGFYGFNRQDVLCVCEGIQFLSQRGYFIFLISILFLPRPLTFFLMQPQFLFLVLFLRREYIFALKGFLQCYAANKMLIGNSVFLFRTFFFIFFPHDHVLGSLSTKNF